MVASPETGYPRQNRRSVARIAGIAWLVAVALAGSGFLKFLSVAQPNVFSKWLPLILASFVGVLFAGWYFVRLFFQGKPTKDYGQLPAQALSRNLDGQPPKTAVRPEIPKSCLPNIEVALMVFAEGPSGKFRFTSPTRKLPGIAPDDKGCDLRSGIRNIEAAEIERIRRSVDKKLDRSLPLYSVQKNVFYGLIPLRQPWETVANHPYGDGKFHPAAGTEINFAWSVSKQFSTPEPWF
jgi:hypothetical protein